MRRLALRGFRLNRLPQAIVQSPNLTELILSDCAITLTPQSYTTLSALNKLVILDLYKNPLELIPNVEHMPQLRYIDVSETGISNFPPSVLTRPHLRTVLLNDNRIQELPTALFDLPNTVRDGFDLGGNPLSAATRERIKKAISGARARISGCLPNRLMSIGFKRCTRLWIRKKPVSLSIYSPVRWPMAGWRSRAWKPNSAPSATTCQPGQQTYRRYTR
ncbi:leucine-rich repeat domain-containing protein [Pseudomonas lini]